MKIISFFAGHDANITVADTDKNIYHIIEIERLVKKRYFRLHVDNSVDVIESILSECKHIIEKNWNFTNDWDELILVNDGYLNVELIRKYFNFRTVRMTDHQHSHAASTFYQSNFDESLIVSYDGGGNDGFFNIYHGNTNGVNFLEKIDCDFGGAYMLLSSCISEISDSSHHQLSLAGKMMGLCAYGVVDRKKSKLMKDFFIDRNYKKMALNCGYNLKNLENPWGDGSIRGPLHNSIFHKEDSYNFAATAQNSFEEKFIEILNILLEKYSSKNLCITGGGALNVLLNQRIKNNYDINLFISPNPNDCGLSLGSILLFHKPKHKINITYRGLPIIDLNKKEELLSNRKCSILDMDYLCKLLKDGKIIGVCREDSEVGPRALGNRSIICDPSFENMKDILNSKVKFREWYRPFAPFCLKEDAEKYFVSKNFDNFEFMSYAPIVKEEFRNKVPSITHIDGTSRLQTVSEESHSFFYNLLKHFSKYSETNILLNTSFNIRGNPILSSIEDALYVLDNTELDCVIINDTLVEK